jgi:hypothetical protein
MALTSGCNGQLLGRRPAANAVARTSQHNARALVLARRSHERNALILQQQQQQQQQRRSSLRLALARSTSRDGPSAIPDLMPLDAGEWLLCAAFV